VLTARNTVRKVSVFEAGVGRAVLDQTVPGNCGPLDRVGAVTQDLDGSLYEIPLRNGYFSDAGSIGV
jgi:hypothetical protein